MTTIEEVRAAKEQWYIWTGGAHWFRGVGIAKVDGDFALSINVEPEYTEEANRAMQAAGNRTT